MERQEEIKKAIDTIIPYANSCRGYGKSAANGFELGVRWADENPKCPWISVDDDLPYNHSELLDPENTAVKMETIPVLTGISFNIFSVGWMEKRQGKWVWHSTIEPQYWMPIPKLPKNSE